MPSFKLLQWGRNLFLVFVFINIFRHTVCLHKFTLLHRSSLHTWSTSTAENGEINTPYLNTYRDMYGPTSLQKKQMKPKGTYITYKKVAQYNIQVHIHMTTYVQVSKRIKRMQKCAPYRTNTHSNTSKKDIIFHKNIYIHIYVNII